ncbi:MAG TPA: hypothetical protein VJ743_08640 [Albitalea sp.]|nr:hypothetical protein [Albitalea sp.]
MTLNQLHALKVWHAYHPHPLERGTWDTVLCLWMAGWVGLPSALILQLAWAQLACVGVMFLPHLYVALRRRLHRSGRLRCDWITALR